MKYNNSKIIIFLPYSLTCYNSRTIFSFKNRTMWVRLADFLSARNYNEKWPTYTNDAVWDNEIRDSIHYLTTLMASFVYMRQALQLSLLLISVLFVAENLYVPCVHLRLLSNTADSNVTQKGAQWNFHFYATACPHWLSIINVQLKCEVIKQII